MSVLSGDRLRLGLINAAPARIIELEFKDHRPLIVALDGRPVEPHEPPKGRVVLGPAVRADLVPDMSGQPGAAKPVGARFCPDPRYELVKFAFSAERPGRKA